MEKKAAIMTVRGNTPGREEDGITPRSSSSSLASVDGVAAQPPPPLTSSPLPPDSDEAELLEDPGDREGVAPSPVKDTLNESFSAIMASAASADDDGGAVLNGIETFKRINDW